jgi:hypothetical protein
MHKVKLVDAVNVGENVMLCELETPISSGVIVGGVGART